MRLSAMARKSIADARRRAGRSALVVAAIALGVGGVSCIDVTERTLAADYDYTLAAQGAHPDLSVTLDRIDPQLSATIARTPGVRTVQKSSVASTQWHVARAPGHVDFTIVGFADPARVPLTPFQLLSGRDPGPGEIVMEYGDAAQGDVRTGDRVVVDTARGTASLRVVGIARTRGQNPAVSGKSLGYMSDTGLAQLAMHTFVNGVPAAPPLITRQVDVSLTAPAAWHAVADTIAAAARGHGAVVLSVVPPRVGASLTGEQNVFPLVWVLVAAVMLLATLLLANTLTELVAEEVRVIGVLKALGATRWRVVRGYLATVMLYAALATPIGLAAGVVLGQHLSSSLAASIPLAPGPFHLAASTVGLGLLVGVGVPLLAAAVPLWLGTRVSARRALGTWGVASPALGGRIGRAVAGHLVRVPQTVWLGTRGLFRRRWSAVLSITTVAVAAVAFLIVQTLVTSLGASVSSVWAGFSADVEVYASGAGATAPLNATLSGVDNIARAERVGWYGDPTPWGKASVWGVEPDTHIFHPRLSAGRWFTAADRNVVVLSEAMVARSHVPLGGTFPVAGPDGGATVGMTVVGLIEQPVDDLSQVGSMVMPVNEVYEREGADPASVAGFTNRVLIAARDRTPAGVDRLTRAIDAAGRTATASRGAGPIAEVLLFHDEVTRHQRSFVPLYDLLYALCVVVAAVGILGLADALTASVVRRRREIGLLRALGAPGRRVGTVFVIEGLTLSGLAWTAAAIVGVPLAHLVVRMFHDDVIPIDARVNPSSLITMLGVAAAIAGLAAVIPARRAASLRTVDLLRHE